MIGFWKILPEGDAVPVRSIELKLVPPHQAGAWQALGTTHRVVMDEAAFYMQELLLLRGRAVATADAALARALGHPAGEDSRDADGLFQLSEAVVQRQLVERLKQQFKKTKEEAQALVPKLQSLYALLVPSVEGRDGDAQAANRLMGPLVDPSSEGGTGAYAKAEAPDWVSLKQAGDSSWEASARDWAAAIAAEPNPTGRQPGWRTALKKDPLQLSGWVESFLKSLSDNAAKIMPGGESALLQELRAGGLLPFLKRPPLKQRIQASRKGERGYLSKWDRLAFKLAISRLLSWESWNLRCANQHEERRHRVEGLEARLNQQPELAAHLRAFEAWRQAELARAGALASEEAYALGRRAVRHFDRLAEAWRTTPGDPKALRDAAATLQKKDPRAFPDPAFVGWLVDHPEAESLWRSEAGVPFVQLWALATEARHRLARTKPTATLTLIHPTLHPNWLEYESASSNLKNFTLEQSEDGALSVALPLLCREEAGLREIEATFPLAPSAQLAVAPGALRELKKEKPRLSFIQAPALHRVPAREAWERWEGAVGSAFVQFDRERLPVDPDDLESGRLGSAFLKLTLDLDPADVPGCLRGEPGAWSKDGPKWAHHLKSGLEAGPATPHEAGLRTGQRVLCVDLGIRTLGAAVAFEITDQAPPSGGIAHPIPAGSGSWWAVEVPGSRRLLALPGEQGADAPEVWAARYQRQQAILEPLRLFKRALSRRRALARYAAVRPFDPGALVEVLQEEGVGLPARARLEATLADLLRPDDPPHGHPPVDLRDRERWEPVLREALGLAPLRPVDSPASLSARRREWDWALEALLGVWRGRSRRRDPRRQDVFGKSIRGIEHLEDVRALLRRWQNRARSGQIKRAERGREGTLAADLLTHINALREDRLKEGANLLVNSARGLAFDPTTGTWSQIHAPCHVLLLEDLNRYRTLKDRPRHENSQLMVWNHRSLLDKVKEMAQLFGIAVETTGADYSSRFHAATGAPGVRVRQIEEADLEAEWLQREVEAHHLKKDTLRAGDWIPWTGGVGFATLGPGRSLVLDTQPLAADLNAAGSLARRYFRRHGEAFKVAARQEADGRWITLGEGARIQGALRATYGQIGGRLIPCPDEPGAFRFEPLPEKDWRKATGIKKTKPAKSGPESGAGLDEESLMDDAELEDAQASEGVHEAHGRPVNFFRDPSGLVLRQDRWYDGKTFWSLVRSRIQNALTKTPGRPPSEEPWSAESHGF